MVQKRTILTPTASDLATGGIRYRDKSQGGQVVPMAAVYHNYEAQEEDEVSIQRGSVVEVLKTDWSAKP